MRTTDEFVAEAMRRAAIILEKRAKRRKRIMVACSSILAAGLIITAGVMLPTGPGQAATAALGAEAASRDVMIGGYVLVGVIAFAAGVTITLLFQKWRRKAAYPYAKRELRGDLL